jgi:DNA-binding CsgD family transcriptional regulator
MGVGVEMGRVGYQFVPAENSNRSDLHVSRVGNTIVVSIPAVPLPEGLSAAEREVVQALLAGRSNLEIARLRGTSVKTVGNQLHAIYRKLRVGSRNELAALLTRTDAADE